MARKSTYPDLIQKLLQSKTVMTLKQIRHALADRPRSSLFRDLKKVELLTSYSHAGQYHALQSTVKFNREDLWFFGQVSFSKYGTLKNTLVKTISSSSAGMTHRELKTLLRVQVQNPLTHLVQTKALQRRLLSEQVFVYLSNEDSQAQEQWHKRCLLNEKAIVMALPPEPVVIDILLEIIRGDERTIDESLLGSRLKKRGVNVQRKQLIYVLIYYDLKKTDHEMIKLIRSRVEQLSDSMNTCYLFPQKPTLHFQPAKQACDFCATELLIQKNDPQSGCYT